MQVLKEFFDTFYTFDTFIAPLKVSVSIMLLMLFASFLYWLFHEICYALLCWLDGLEERRDEKKNKKVNLDKSKKI